MSDAAARSGLLRAALGAAVPLWIAELRKLPLEDVLARARECGQVIAEKGDVLQFRGKKGESAAAFNSLARGLASLAFCPGGVTFLGDHWEAKHPETEGREST